MINDKKTGCTAVLHQCMYLMLTVQRDATS